MSNRLQKSLIIFFVLAFVFVARMILGDSSIDIEKKSSHSYIPVFARSLYAVFIYH